MGEDTPQFSLPFELSAEQILSLFEPVCLQRAEISSPLTSPSAKSCFAAYQQCFVSFAPLSKVLINRCVGPLNWQVANRRDWTGGYNLPFSVVTEPIICSCIHKPPEPRFMSVRKPSNRHYLYSFSIQISYALYIFILNNYII
jgi:hypothetical protein